MLFQSLGLAYEIPCCPKVFRKDTSNLCNEPPVHLTNLLGNKRSDIYVGALLLKKLKAITHIRWFNLSFIGGRSISS